MAEAKDDPFGWLIKFCKPTFPQELKLQTCHLAGEFGSFPDYFDLLASSSPETLPLDTLVIGSPLETVSQEISSIDTSNPQRNEDFLSPPENHIPLSSFTQEDRQRLQPITPSDSKESASVFAETMSDHGCVESEVSVNLGKKNKNRGLSDTENIYSHDADSEGEIQFNKGKRIDVYTLGEQVAEDGNSEGIEKFRSESPRTGVDNSVKKRGRDLPPSIRGTQEDKQGGENSRYIKVKKASWNDIVNAFWEGRDDDDDCEGTDLLEAAKRRGLTFLILDGCNDLLTACMI